MDWTKLSSVAAAEVLVTSFLRLNASQLSDFERPRASPCNDTPYESEITTARLKSKSP